MRAWRTLPSLPGSLLARRRLWAATGSRTSRRWAQTVVRFWFVDTSAYDGCSFVPRSHCSLSVGKAPPTPSHHHLGRIWRPFEQRHEHDAIRFPRSRAVGARETGLAGTRRRSRCVDGCSHFKHPHTAGDTYLVYHSVRRCNAWFAPSRLSSSSFCIRHCPRSSPTRVGVAIRSPGYALLALTRVHKPTVLFPRTREVMGLVSCRH